MKEKISAVVVCIALLYAMLCIPGQIDYAVEYGEEINDASIAIQTVVTVLVAVVGMKIGGRDDDEYSNL